MVHSRGWQGVLAEGQRPWFPSTWASPRPPLHHPCVLAAGSSPFMIPASDVRQHLLRAELCPLQIRAPAS